MLALLVDKRLKTTLSYHRKTRSEILSTFERRKKNEREAHELRIAHMNRRITDYHTRVRCSLSDN